jgi:EmrB/QacA subfamily drug resistance transporter
VLGVPMLLGPIFGPILGGWLIDVASWHWIFLINLPIGVAALVYSAIVLPRDDVEPSETFDWVGMLLLSPGLALFLFGVSSIPEAQQKHEGYHVLGLYLSDRVWITALLGVVLIVAFVPWALRRSNVHPLVDLRLFQHREITIAVIAMALFAIAFFGATLLFPLYFQQVHGESPLNSGWLMAPQGFGAMLTMPIAGVLADRIGPGKVVLTGLVLDTVGMGFFAFVGSHDSYGFLIAGLVIMGLGMGATMMPIMSAALAQLNDASIARGSTLMNINQQVAASIGTALFSVLLTSALNSHPHDLPGSYGQVFVVATILVGLCLVPALFLPRRKVEAPARVPVPVH